MKKGKYIVLFFLILSATSVFAQQGAILKPIEMDSTELLLHRQMEYLQLISGNLANESFNQELGKLKFNPVFEYKQGYIMNLDLFNINNLPLTGFSTGNMNSFNSPFFHNGVILSEGAYSLGNKLIFGGFSYGANSVFSAPFPNQQMNNFDTYGSTLFMQYKVSKKFKIQTRVNVSRGPGPDF